MRQFLIIGKNGTGKTVNGVEIFNDYKDLKTFLNVQHENYPIIGQTVYNIKEWAKCEFRSYDFRIENEDIFSIIVDYIKTLQEMRLEKKKEARYLLVVDEADNYCDVQASINDENYKAIKFLCRKARRWNIDVMFISQKPQRLHPDIYSQTDLFIIYYLNEKDWKYLRNNADLDVTDEMIENTKPYLSYKYIKFNDVTFTACEPIKLDGKWRKVMKNQPVGKLDNAVQ